MKNALILHGTNGNSKENWFDWLRIALQKQNWNVWVPDLPQSQKPNIERYTAYILNNKEWRFDSESIIIGHSSGAVAALGLLERLPSETKINACYLVGVFRDNLGWDSLSELFIRPLDYAAIQKKAKQFVVIHSDNDPYCPLEGAKYVGKALHGSMHILKGQKHFSIGTMGDQYKTFPFLLDMIQTSIH